MGQVLHRSETRGSCDPCHRRLAGESAITEATKRHRQARGAHHDRHRRPDHHRFRRSHPHRHRRAHHRATPRPSRQNADPSPIPVGRMPSRHPGVQRRRAFMVKVDLLRRQLPQPQEPPGSSGKETSSSASSIRSSSSAAWPHDMKRGRLSPLPPLHSTSRKSPAVQRLPK